jgi:D-tyrosyl-tRNA(Tyr) deacylase
VSRRVQRGSGTSGDSNPRQANQAAPPEAAQRLYEAFIAAIGAQGIPVATGKFRAMMQVELVNDGPVTLLLDSRKRAL